MTLDNKRIETLLEAYNKSELLNEYRQEKKNIHDILTSNPFDAEKARQQISTIISKYSIEINATALLSGNGRITVFPAPPKTPEQLRDDLTYLDDNLLRFMLEHEGLSNLLNEIIDR